LKYFILLIFSPLYLLYYFILRFRHFLYDFSILKINKSPIPVISIGNVTVGGTGKTPFTIDLAKVLDDVCVVSRGYKRNSKGLVVVSDKSSVLLDADTGGDEPFMIASNANVPVICSSDRYAGCLEALRKFQSSYILLDDGFQHRQLSRELDIVVIDSVRFLGNRLLLPFGVLRDIPSRINRADLILLSKVNDLNRCKEQIEFLEKNYSKSVVYSKPTYKQIKNDIESIPLNSIDNSVFLFCGIGHPEPFFQVFES